MSDWRTEVPERYRNLPNMITMGGIAELFGYTQTHVRRMRQAERHATLSDEIPEYSALPAARDDLPGTSVIWWTEDIIRWGLTTGRINPETGEIMHLPSSGRTPRGTRGTVAA
jgi:hypothetical protein